MLKKDSVAWKLAVKISRRKHTFWVPVALSDCGNIVTVQGIIRGNTWKLDKRTLETCS